MTELQSTSGLARRAAGIVADIVEKSEVAEGVSDDQYTEQPVYHAMADGKKLQLLSLCFNANWISETWFTARRDAALERLEIGRSVLGDRAAWGLGFSYKDLPSNEPYLITTSVVARGLLEASRRIALREPQARLATSAYRWISEFIVQTTGPLDEQPEIPAFSTNEPLRVYNSAAYACALIVQLAGEVGKAPSPSAFKRAQGVLELVKQALEPGLGWPYAASRRTVDLVHQGYIFNSLAEVYGADALGVELLKSLSLFMCSDICFDRFDIETIETAMARNEAAASAKTLLMNDFGLIFGKPARLWSLGEILVALCRLQASAANSRYVEIVIRRVVSQLIALYDSAFDGSTSDLRQQLHAAHGLAAWLRTSRIAPRFPQL